MPIRQSYSVEELPGMTHRAPEQLGATPANRSWSLTRSLPREKSCRRDPGHPGSQAPLIFLRVPVLRTGGRHAQPGCASRSGQVHLVGAADHRSSITNLSPPSWRNGGVVGRWYLRRMNSRVVYSKAIPRIALQADLRGRRRLEAAYDDPKKMEVLQKRLESSRRWERSRRVVSDLLVRRERLEANA